MKPSFTARAKGTVLLAVLLLLFAFGAVAEGSGVTLFDAASGKWQPDNTQKAATVGGTLYIARMDGLYAWNIGEEPRQLMDFSKTGLDGAARIQAEAPMDISRLMSEDGVLYALDDRMEGLWRFDEGTGVFVKMVFYDAGEAVSKNEEGSYRYDNFLLDRGEVYYIARNTMSVSSNLVKLNAKSGKAEVVKAGICLSAPYFPGKLLVASGPVGWPESVSVLDLDTGRLTKKADISRHVESMYY